MPESNRDVFDRLCGEGRMPICRASLFDTKPVGVPSSWDRVRGMMLGLAIGDALGNTTEGQLPYRRRKEHGEVRDYLPNRYADGRPVGLPSDDSQMAFWTLESLLKQGGLDAGALAETFARRRIFGMGSSVGGLLDAYRSGTVLWAAAPASAGNGALMRIAPVVIPYVRAPSADLWIDAALLARLTHDDSMSVASCVAFVALLWECLARDSPPPGPWWMETFTSSLSSLETARHYRPRGGAFSDFEGSLGEYLEATVPEALSWEDGNDRSPIHRLWYSGAFLLETVPWVIYVLSRWGHDPEAAIIRAVNDTKDNDTAAAIVGAAVGALHGAAALPRRWVEGLTGRTGEGDDGRMFELLDQAEARWS